MTEIKNQIGHNGPPLDPKPTRFTPQAKVGRIIEILDREDLSATQKCVGIAVVATADVSGVSTLGRLDLARMASAKDKATIFAATDRLDGDLVEKIKRPGKENSYRVLPQQIVDGVVQAFNDLRTGRAKPTHSTDELGGSNPPREIFEVGGINPPSGNEPARPGQPGGLEPASSNQPGGPELGSFTPPSGVTPTQFTRVYINSSSEDNISTEQDIRKGGVGENLPFDDLPETHSEPKRAKSRAKPSAEQFDRFWDAYPLRKGKHKALERFMALTPNQAEQAIAGAKTFATECAGKDPQFIKWAQGWLSERRFADQPTEPSQHPTLAAPNGKLWGWWRGIEEKLRGLSIERWQEAISSAKPNGTWPWWILAAPPGHPECLMPPELVEKYGYGEIYKGQITHE